MNEEIYIPGGIKSFKDGDHLYTLSPGEDYDTWVRWLLYVKNIPVHTVEAIGKRFSVGDYINIYSDDVYEIVGLTNHGRVWMARIKNDETKPRHILFENITKVK